MSKKELWENIIDISLILGAIFLCLMDKDGWGWLLLIYVLKNL
jgi:hypothetical protein